MRSRPASPWTPTSPASTASTRSSITLRMTRPESTEAYRAGMEAVLQARDHDPGAQALPHARGAARPRPQLRLVPVVRRSPRKDASDDRGLPRGPVLRGQAAVRAPALSTPSTSAARCCGTCATWGGRSSSSTRLPARAPSRRSSERPGLVRKGRDTAKRRPRSRRVGAADIPEDAVCPGGGSTSSGSTTAPQALAILVNPIAYRWHLLAGAARAHGGGVYAAVRAPRLPRLVRASTGG